MRHSIATFRPVQDPTARSVLKSLLSYWDREVPVSSYGVDERVQIVYLELRLLGMEGGEGIISYAISPAADDDD